jgi:hypothetical protein
LIRVYLRTNGSTDDEPAALHDGATVADVADYVHHDLGATFTSARIWGPSAQFDGQRVGRDHVVQDTDTVEILTHVPGAKCTTGDRGAVASLRPDTRRAWLAANPLPKEVRYYSVVTLPDPERISSILKRSYRKLAQVDARNDSQTIFYDQVIPGSELLGYLNADHWAAAVPIGRTHTTIAAMFVTQNDYPREALLQAILRFVEEDLDANR